MLPAPLEGSIRTLSRKKPSRDGAEEVPAYRPRWNRSFRNLAPQAYGPRPVAGSTGTFGPMFMSHFCGWFGSTSGGLVRLEVRAHQLRALTWLYQVGN